MAEWTTILDTHVSDLRQRCEAVRATCHMGHTEWTACLADWAGLGYVTVHNFRLHPDKNFTIETLKAIDKAVSEMEDAL